MDLNTRGIVNYLLLPVSGIFYLVSALRKWLYQIDVFKTYHFDKPVIVVGNITVGGTGKTPIVIALVEYFKQQGKKVGVVSRGYGGNYKGKTSIILNKESRVKEVGDEPVLIYRQTKVLVMVNKNRAQAVQDLITQHNVDIIISDDGLQHYSMGRAVEICVKNGFGNGFLLPAGALRESLKRLKTVDFVLESNITPIIFVNLVTGKKKSLDYFAQQYVHAVAGIGKPDNFFSTLESLNIKPMKHSLPDHHTFNSSDLIFEEEYPILMTAKDWVKCENFATDNMWYLQVEARLGECFLTQLKTKL